jgi:hypothetical protein
MGFESVDSDLKRHVGVDEHGVVILGLRPGERDHVGLGQVWRLDRLDAGDHVSKLGVDAAQYVEPVLGAFLEAVEPVLVDLAGDLLGDTPAPRGLGDLDATLQASVEVGRDRSPRDSLKLVRVQGRQRVRFDPDCVRQIQASDTKAAPRP